MNLKTHYSLYGLMSFSKQSDDKGSSIDDSVSSYSFQATAKKFSNWFTKVYDETKPMKWWEHFVPVHGFLRGVPRYIEKYKSLNDYVGDEHEWAKRIDKRNSLIFAQFAYLVTIGLTAAALTYDEPKESSSISLPTYSLEKTIQQYPDQASAQHADSTFDTTYLFPRDMDL